MADSAKAQNESTHPRASTGVERLDDILGGGLPRHWLCLAQGTPGTGKATLGLQFLLQGAQEGEDVLFITLSQTQRRLKQIARSHGWSLDGVHLRELATGRGGGPQTILHTDEVELGETVDALIEAIEEVDPDRLVFDSVAEIRDLASSPLRYRRQLLALRRQLAECCTALFLDNVSEQDGDGELGGLADGLIHLDQSAPDYGDVRRRLQVVKMRGIPFHGGYHNFQIRTGGLEVYPRLKASDEAEHAEKENVESGMRELDALLGGGLQKGTAALLLGATGTGKTTLATIYAYAMAERGEKAAIFAFDERPETFYQRAEGIGLPIRPHVEAGRIKLTPIDTGELSPGEFSQVVRRSVEEEDAQLIAIDSLTGYINAMPQEKMLLTQMHELLTFASRKGVLTMLIAAQHGLMGTGTAAPMEVSYMSDTVLLLRHFEALGSIRKAISVVKKRYGPHEKTIREMEISPEGVVVGDPIDEFSGVLTGNPRFEGTSKDLMEKEGASNGSGEE